MKLKGKNAISLIVLVITILVLSILAATVIISISNTNVISETSKTVFKSDMSSYKEAYEMYVASELAKNVEFDRTTLNLTYRDDEFSKIFGNVSERYKEGLKVVSGKLVYESADEAESKVLEQMGMKLEYIDKDTSYVGYFADVDGDGTVDGVIFADLCIGGSAGWRNVGCQIPLVENKSTVKEYYISKESYAVPNAVELGEHPVLTATGTGEDRFYVMALEDLNGGTRYCWYDAAYDNGISDYSTITSENFGAGKQNTHNMIMAWNNETYGKQDDNGTYLDLWGVVQDKVYNGKERTLENIEWFVPSICEWSAFAGEMGLSIGEVLGEPGCKWYWEFGLSIDYWSSSLISSTCSWWISPGGGSEEDLWGEINRFRFVLLCAISDNFLSLLKIICVLANFKNILRTPQTAEVFF